MTGMARRRFLAGTGLAGLGGLAAGSFGPTARAATPADDAPAAAGRTGGAGAIPYPTLARPFAMPGVKDQDWSGALFVTRDEARFAVRVGLLTAAGTLIREKMTNNLWRFGPSAPDGVYKQVVVSSDDRKVMPAHLDALREVIAHPDWYTAEEVTDAQATLPQLEQKYATAQDQKRSIRVRYARSDGGRGVVAAVTALDADLSIVLEVAAPWTETPKFQVANGCVLGTEPGVANPSRTGHFALAPDEPAERTTLYASVGDMVAGETGGSGAAGTAVAALRYDLAKGQTISFTATCGDEPVTLKPVPRHRATALLDSAQARVTRGYLTGSGPVGRVADAVRDALSLNTNYDRTTLRNFVMWGWSGAGGLFTGWDSAFDAIEATSVSADLAMQHERDIFAAPPPPDQVKINGPRYDQQNSGPMHAYAVWRLYTRLGDRDLVATAYPQLVAFFDLLPEWDADGDGLLESPYFGDRISGRGNHLGLDDSPVYADYRKVPKKGGSGDPRPNTNLTDVALNAYYALMAELLAKMARLQGKTADATRFEAIHERIKTGVNAKLWNEERGLYLSRYLDGGWNEVVTPTVFYPLLAGLATPERARVLVEDHLLDPKEFWGEYVIPSVARNDPKYCSGGPVHPRSEHFKFFKNYDDKGAPEEWKGAAWPPMNFTVYEGLKRYGFDREAGELAARSTAMYLNAYDRDGWFPESFDPEPGQSIMDSAVDTAWRTYSWSNAMAVQTIHELLSDEPWGEPEALMFGSLTLPGTNSVSNLVLRGHRYAVTAGPRTTTVTRDGRPFFRSEGGRVAVRAFVLSEKGASFDITADAPTKVEVATGSGRTRSARVPSGHHHVEL
ncbi:trehalase family glycosidase [Actinoallomurus sp. NBC_01490]|uniref:amylo-alpha-1,6-glucosidase n=1 Tax=Actinoallomurus sp. NBC_01490 TaxID=2903557 RepID=UPI002E356424|nr:trehalase family glycosidase [Actinoallomurus sp. NBC_01490]